MSLAYAPTETTIPLGYIRSGFADRDPMHGKMLYLESDGQSVMRKIFEQQREQERKGGLIPLSTIRAGEIPQLLERAREETKKARELSLEEHRTFEPAINPNARLAAFIFGAPGAGKSYLASLMAEDYHRMHPAEPVWLFSLGASDKAFDRFKWVKRICVSDHAEQLLDNPVVVQELSNSLVIFDDCDQIRNKELFETLNHLRDDALELGRKMNINVIVTSHYPNKGKKTSSVPKHASNMTAFFPKGGERGTITRYLQSSMNMTKKQAESIASLPSRWIIVMTDYPGAILSERYASVL